MDVTVNYNPSQDDIRVIKNLLVKEKEEGQKKTPLYNWESIILPAIDEDRFVALYHAQNPIGFAVWRDCGEKIVEIEHIWIDKKFRRKGIGKIFQNILTDFFRRGEFLIIEILCVSVEGEKVSESVGFISLENEYGGDDRRKYLPLGNCRTIKTAESYICDCPEFYICYYKETEREQCKKIPLYGNLQKMPVIVDIPGDWRVEFICNGKVVKEGTSKYLFKRMNYKHLLGRYAIIDKLPTDI